ncbi:hypothetical protein [Bartonella australis]|nr:hypothetical protein [Bartonella australis]
MVIKVERGSKVRMVILQIKQGEERVDVKNVGAENREVVHS